jgi:hypothetical protein
MTSEHRATSRFLDYMEVIFGPLQGFLNGLVYGINYRVLGLYRDRFFPCCRDSRCAEPDLNRFDSIGDSDEEFEEDQGGKYGNGLEAAEDEHGSLPRQTRGSPHAGTARGSPHGGRAHGGGIQGGGRSASHEYGKPLMQHTQMGGQSLDPI